MSAPEDPSPAQNTDPTLDPPDTGPAEADLETEAAEPATPGTVDAPESRAARRRTKQRARTRKRSTALAAIAALAVGTATLLATTALTVEPAAVPGHPIPANAANGTITVGPAEADLLVDVYAEPACSDCEDAMFELAGPLRQALNAGVARVQYHLTATSSPAALTAVNAATCASDISAETGASFLEAVLTNVFPDAAHNGYLEMAHAFDIATAATLDCIKTGKYKPFLTEQGKTAPEPQAAPTFLINGKTATTTDLADQLTAAAARAISGIDDHSGTDPQAGTPDTR